MFRFSIVYNALLFSNAALFCYTNT